jgi:hypothetical protein
MRDVDVDVEWWNSFAVAVFFELKFGKHWYSLNEG